MKVRTVMVVEDSEADAQLLMSSLRGILPRAAIVHMPTTTETERYLFEESRMAGGSRANPDLVFLDIRIPPAGGLSVLRRMRADARTRSIPVVVVSGLIIEEDIRGLYLSGANSFLRKPDDSQEFHSLLKSAASYWLKVNLSPQLQR